MLMDHGGGTQGRAVGHSLVALAAQVESQRKSTGDQI